MAQNIRDFYTAATQKDFARQFQFRINTLGTTNLAQDELVYLETANLPGRAITNIPVPFMGLQFNVPGTVTFPGSDAWAVTFRCDQNYDIRAKLENATINTFDESTSTGDYNIARNSSRIILQLIGKNPDNVIRQYTLYGAYVVSIGESTYNLTDSGNIVTIPATLAYQYWSVTDVGTSSVPAALPTSSAETNISRWGE